MKVKFDTASAGKPDTCGICWLTMTRTGRYCQALIAQFSRV